MSIGEFCNRVVVFTNRTMSIPEAARLMRKFHVGDLVVADEVDGRQVPVGMITDRDIVVEMIAQSLDINAVTVGDIMSPQLFSVREDAGELETIQLMRDKGVRRLPVVNENGVLVGIVSADDILEVLAEAMTDLARVSTRGQEHEVKART